MDITQVDDLVKILDAIGIQFTVTPIIERVTSYTGTGIQYIVYNGYPNLLIWFFRSYTGIATSIQNRAYVVIPAQDATLSYKCKIFYKPFSDSISFRTSALAGSPSDVALYDDEMLLKELTVTPVGSEIIVTPPAPLYEPVITAGTTAQYWRGDKSWQALNKSAVGLANVDNTADSAKNVLSATKLTTARNINGVSFDGTGNITIVDSTKEPAFAAGTTAQYLRGDKTWQTLPAAGSVWNDFLPFISTTPASTGTLNRTGSYDFTTILKVGYGLKYKIGSTYYYGIVTAITATLLTVAGVSLSSTIVEIYYCDQRNTMIQDIEINNFDWLAAATDILVSGYTKHPLKSPSGWLVLIETWAATVDTGATKSKIKLMNGANAVSSITDGVELTTNATYNTSLVTIQSAYYYYAGMTNVRVDISQVGSNKNTTNAKVKLYWILE